MKIPETSANVGAYYGNEGNGQWQPNGVIIDSGVGGGIVGSGDAGLHRTRPVYPVHIPRGHTPGYVMAGAYYPAAAAPPVHDDFADYMWMENEEEFDEQVMQQLEEEALMEQCIEAMLEDEQRERRSPRDGQNTNNASNGVSSLSLEETVSRSTLNPLAAEFVPTRRPPPPTIAENPETSEMPVTADSTKRPQTDGDKDAKSEVDGVIESTQNSNAEVAIDNSETPVVSAADILPITKKDKKEVPKQKVDAKKTKQEPRKAKPVAVTAKSDTKVTAKKKDVKPVKSEGRVEEALEVVEGGDFAKVAPSPVEEPKEVNTGFKPINYAAAAKASKPKPKPTSPSEEKPPPIAKQTEKPTPVQMKPEKLAGKTEKKPPAKKPNEKVPQRKNSAK